MARDICSDCGGPREPHSTSFSYCTECVRKRQRERYRSLRKAAGFEVRPQHDEVDHRRRALEKADGKPGQCEICSEMEPLKLTLVYTGDKTDEQELISGGTPFVLMCQPCRVLTKRISTPSFERLMRIGEYLNKRKTDFDKLLPDVMDFYTPASAKEPQQDLL